MTIDFANNAFVFSFFAALIPYLALIVAKENKISEFRQAWIDSLREELAQLVGHMNGLEGTLRQDNTRVEAWKEGREDVIGINRCIAMIRMRLNPKEDQAKKLGAILDELSGYFAPRCTSNTERFNDIEKRLLSESQVFLKEEWARVRKGEFFFAKTRATFLVLVVIILIPAAWTGVRHLF